MMVDIGGSYAATAGGLMRISRGSVIAVGRNHLILVDCDMQYRCSNYLYDRSTRQRRRISSRRLDQGPYGSLSDDGRHAALSSWLPRSGGNELTVLDTLSGRSVVRLTSVRQAPSDSGSTVWLPDGRLVGVHDGRIFTFDPRRGAVEYPDLELPGSLIQLALRCRF